MADEEETFVTRWSRRKRGARDEEQADGPGEGRPGEALPGPVPDAGAVASSDPAAGDPEVIANLPAIEDLNETSDFTPFMAKGVPEVLRRRALRKLWRINPLFAHLDGLNDYDEDFTDAAALLTEVKTIYKVGKGMVSDEPPAEKTEAEVLAEAEAQDRERDDAAQADAGETESDEVAASAIADVPGLEAEAAEAGGPDPVPAPMSKEPTAVRESVGTGPVLGAAGDGARLEGPTKRKTESDRRSAAARRWGESPG